jgi:hypothetical protein
MLEVVSSSLRSATFANPLVGVPNVESPFFDQIFTAESVSADVLRIARDLNRDGLAVIDFPDPDFNSVAERIKSSLAPQYDWKEWRENGWAKNRGLRVQDAWKSNPDVRRIAANQQILDLLETLYGRRAFPFQSLNFPVGTQQATHNDAVHFHSVPERFMCGVWVALEDADEENGALEYYPRSHELPLFVNEHIGACSAEQDQPFAHYNRYLDLWRQLIEARGYERTIFRARKGQALIWLATLLHGGSRHNNPDRTRWSQVTHYFFEDCTYLTPLASDAAYGQIHYRQVQNILTGENVPNCYGPYQVSQEVMARKAPKSVRLPAGFDPKAYLAANPDVAMAGGDAAQHYLAFGRHENRRLA